MTNQQILKKAIEKAVKNGWDKENKTYWKAAASSKSLLKVFMCDKEYYRLIFSHDFAKAFWGEGEPLCIVCGGTIPDNCDHSNAPFVLNWHYHLKEMVLEKDPIKYLEKFL